MNFGDLAQGEQEYRHQVKRVGKAKKKEGIAEGHRAVEMYFFGWKKQIIIKSCYLSGY